ncbi:MAG: DUF1275 family protein [Acetobacteraceae bacterium]
MAGAAPSRVVQGSRDLCWSDKERPAADEADRRLACSLAAIAGALNAAGFYAVGFYSSHMTGNTSSIADNLALGDLAGPRRMCSWC